jgi:hypothetical protein
MYPAQAQRAIEKFFQLGNLTALRKRCAAQTACAILLSEPRAASWAYWVWPGRNNGSRTSLPGGAV